MATEIERKFRVHREAWSRVRPERSEYLKQGYLVNETGKVVRLRMGESQAWLTIKGKTSGATRAEFEYEIPREDAAQLFALFGLRCIEKTRHFVTHEGHLWEVDVFAGENEGLLIAEIELGSEEESFALPAWAGEEVTSDARYYNANLFDNPWCRWGDHD